MKKLILFSFLIALSVCFYARLAVSATETPRAVIADGIYDFGIVKQGEKVVHHFTIRNEGEAPLTVTDIDLFERGLTVKVNRTIPPGQERNVTVEWDTSNLTGTVQAKPTLRLNDPDQPKMVLTLRAIVKSPIEIRPFSAVFFSLWKDETAEKSVTIVNTEEHPLNIVGLEPEGNHFEARIETVEAGKVYRVVVKVPPETPPGRYMEALYLKTDKQTHSRIRVAVNVLVKNEIYVSREVLDFGQVNSGQLERYPKLIDFLSEILILRKRQGEFRIESIESDIPFLKITQDPAEKSRVFRVDIGIDKEKLQRGIFAGTVRIRTDDNDFPELKIPVKGMVM